jgi:hypothetical protein
MALLRLSFIIATITGLACARPAAGQVATVLYGRVEDALTRAPLSNVRLFAADSSSAVLTDSLGVFALPLGPDAQLAILAERLGYFTQRFDLPAEATTRESVLLLEPMAIELEGITVEEESALATLVGGLENRRNAWGFGSVFAYDRERLDRLAGGGSMWDFVRRQRPLFRECPPPWGVGLICVPGRTRTVANPNPSSTVSVCIDGWPALIPVTDLAGLSAGAVALVEFYGREQIRVYTADYLLMRARRGDTNVTPLWMGC